MSNALRLYTARSGSSATNSTTVALSAATAKSVVGVLGAATDTIAVVEFGVSFNSVTATDVPATVELGVISALGTTTAFTPVQNAGPYVLASSATAGYNATVEPTYQRIIETFYVPVNYGLFVKQYPLNQEPVQQAASQGFAVRVTSPSAASCFAYLKFAE